MVYKILKLIIIKWILWTFLKLRLHRMAHKNTQLILQGYLVKTLGNWGRNHIIRLFSKELLDMVWYKLWFPTKSLITVIIPVESCKFMCALDPSPNPPCTLKMKYFWLLMWRVGGLVRHIKIIWWKPGESPLNVIFYFILQLSFGLSPSINNLCFLVSVNRPRIKVENIEFCLSLIR